MLSRLNGVVWMEEEGEEEEDAVSWTRNNRGGGGARENNDDLGSLSTFKSMLEDDWYVHSGGNSSHHDFQSIQNHQDIISSNTTVADNLLLQSVDSSSSCSPSSVFTLDPSQVQSFLPPKSCLSSLLNVVCSNPFESGFDFGCDAGFLAPLQGNQNTNSPALMNSGGGVLTEFTGLCSEAQVGIPDLSSNSQFQSTRLLSMGENISTVGAGFRSSGFGGFEGSGNPLFLNRSKMLGPLEIFPPVGAQPTLFQKRAALRQNYATAPDKSGNLGFLGSEGNKRKRQLDGDQEKGRKNNNEDDEMEEASIDGFGLNYDSDEATENNNNKEEEEDNTENGENNSNANSTVTGTDQKGKKKGLPAKNLMAERRRRKKLNDRLYMLRSVVPKISKMDRASILGDAIDYLKELLQRINDLHNELESTPPGSSIPLTTTTFLPLTPTPPTLPCRVKEELCPSSVPSPNSQPARVEVRVREGRAVNIHMFCARRPGLLLSTMKALDRLGLDIQQAVISCFNGFALDVFRAEQCKAGPDVLPEDIKAVLLESTGFHEIRRALSFGSSNGLRQSVAQPRHGDAWQRMQFNGGKPRLDWPQRFFEAGSDTGRRGTALILVDEGPGIFHLHLRRKVRSPEGNGRYASNGVLPSLFDPVVSTFEVPAWWSNQRTKIISPPKLSADRFSKLQCPSGSCPCLSLLLINPKFIHSSN
ncbi:hypothetical protein NE237_020285 [Protea cynaroides]|uniref:Uncharacterized protein n=1 Tax=Protea cynaroides TaxID=273540 RepID=A0A9Q0H6Y1_9MAGN|nr:hypothetical protein NE237_020285 [Protea cynaroides]